jgi:hypothetical protein
MWLQLVCAAKLASDRQMAQSWGLLLVGPGQRRHLWPSLCRSGCEFIQRSFHRPVNGIWDSAGAYYELGSPKRGWGIPETNNHMSPDHRLNNMDLDFQSLGSMCKAVLIG